MDTNYSNTKKTVVLVSNLLITHDKRGNYLPMGTTTEEFYDEFWPKNVPYYEETKKYMLETIRERSARNALDAGCGHGVCSVVLSEIADQVVAVDISAVCLDTASKIAQKYNRTNIIFEKQDLQELDLKNQQFDLVWCWGVAMMAPDPIKVMHNLMEATTSGGTIYLGLYLKTWLSPVHQAVRHFCRKFMNTPTRKKFVLNLFAGLTNLIIKLRGSEINLRSDNVSIQTQVDDWFYPPHKTFYTKEEIIALFQKNGFESDIIQDQVGRMKSATIFVVRAKKTGLKNTDKPSLLNASI